MVWTKKNRGNLTKVSFLKNRGVPSPYFLRSVEPSKKWESLSHEDVSEGMRSEALDWDHVPNR